MLIYHSKEDIHLEAVRALKPPRPNADEDTYQEPKTEEELKHAMPQFPAVVKYIQEKVCTIYTVLKKQGIISLIVMYCKFGLHCNRSRLQII